MNNDLYEESDDSEKRIRIAVTPEQWEQLKNANQPQWKSAIALSLIITVGIGLFIGGLIKIMLILLR